MNLISGIILGLSVAVMYSGKHNSSKIPQSREGNNNQWGHNLDAVKELNGQRDSIFELEELEGEYPLTKEVEIRIKGNRLSMDRDTSYVVESQGNGKWFVPGLEMGFSAQRDKEGQQIVMERFGERVVLGNTLPPVFDNYKGVPLDQLANEIAPRLMIASHVPGVSLAIIQDEEVVLDMQFGLSNSSNFQSRVTASTVFEACSMSKPVFAYFALRLVEEGKLDLDTPLVDYLGKDYTEDPLHREITARMVLTHSSGFPNWRPGGRSKGGPIPVHFEPGTQQRYSGEGIWFLQQAVESILGIQDSGSELDALLHQTLLEPIGMPNSHFIWQDHYNETYADGHNSSGMLKRQDRRMYKEVNSAFTLYTTPVEYARFLIELMKTDRSAQHSLGGELLDTMTSPQSGALNNDILPRRNSTAQGTRYFGLGLRIDQLDSGLRIGHTGSNSSGHKCVSDYNPQFGDGLVVMTNSDSGNDVYLGLMRYLAN